MKLVFATNNKYKLNEITAILNSVNNSEFEILSLADIGFIDEIQETGSTLEQNALIKAMAVYNKFGIDCFADDSGLETEALDGKPGIYSARYSGENSSYIQNNEKLLDELKNKTNRNACFRTVIALILKGEIYYFEGKINGKINEIPLGNYGFGYDPLFIPYGYNITFAQMPEELKNTLSHRKIAISKMADFLI
ncbi:MAG: RdgB/HAM1 family non-canonical purine NTP pyrophosphatase [Bacteroidia bacterium]|nr:RdgB/HAM1 family non-canonical purine NTP pyrophosphatase [Bacteroidia bacterium]